MCPSAPPGSQGFPKSRRLRTRVEYQRVYEHGTRLRGAGFAVFCRRAEASGPGRVGFSVPRRVGGAVVRNRVKRRLRELIRRQWDKLPEGCELVFHIYPAILDATDAELEAQIERAFHESSRSLQRRRDNRSRLGRPVAGS